jgi:hypothetical protein
MPVPHPAAGEDGGLHGRPGLVVDDERAAADSAAQALTVGTRTSRRHCRTACLRRTARSTLVGMPIAAGPSCRTTREGGSAHQLTGSVIGLVMV